MHKEILFLDKDDTLCEMGELLPGMEEFLAVQSKVRDCVIATNASQQGRIHLKTMDHHLAGYYGKEDFDDNYFVNENGVLAKVAGRVLDESVKYHNPYGCKNSPRKDLFLAKRLQLPRDYENARCVMIGNVDDIGAAESDPSIPLIEVFAHPESIPNWAENGRVSAILSVLFANSTPAQIFDELFQKGIRAETSRSDTSWGIHQAVISTIRDMRFRLKQGLGGQNEVRARVIEEYDRY